MTNLEREARSFTAYLFEHMPKDKQMSFARASYRNCYLTSEYTLRNAHLTVYKEGWYIEFEGCRSRFAAFAADNDGEFVWKKKPVDSKLHKLWGRSFDNNFIYGDQGNPEEPIWILYNLLYT